MRLFLFIPLNLLYAYSNSEINYRAGIDGGLLILHPCAGVVISKYAKVGRNLTMTGDNFIGARTRLESGTLVVGDNCYMGPNAVVIGPCALGNNVTVGPNSVVMRDCKDGITMIGVLATGLELCDVQV